MHTSALSEKGFRKLEGLTIFFVALALPLYLLEMAQLSWAVLMVCALVWFGMEARGKREMLPSALKIGAFLMGFDFIIENSGWILGLWQTRSSLAIGVVPLEVMAVALFGGTAWALYLPRVFNLWYSLADCTVFASFGALGEWLLIRQGLFVYESWWTSLLAFSLYFLTWALLHFLRYGVFKEARAEYLT